MLYLALVVYIVDRLGDNMKVISFIWMVIRQFGLFGNISAKDIVDLFYTYQEQLASDDVSFRERNKAIINNATFPIGSGENRAYW
jgi:hypothetical protein